MLKKNNILKEKTQAELDKHYQGIELEKGDFLAMLIAAIITFGPVILIIALIYIGLAAIFIF